MTDTRRGVIGVCVIRTAIVSGRDFVTATNVPHGALLKVKAGRVTRAVKVQLKYSVNRRFITWRGSLNSRQKHAGGGPDSKILSYPATLPICLFVVL